MQTEEDKWSMTQTAKEALRYVEDEEKTTARKSKKMGNRKTVDWDEFMHLSLTWVISAVAIATVLLILALEEGSEDLFHDIINRIDALSLMFSLVLSAALEQIWNHKDSKMFQCTLAGELILVIGGLVWYLVCSIHEIQLRDPSSKVNVDPVFIERFRVHAAYIVLSIVCVFVGFFARVSVGQEEK